MYAQLQVCCSSVTGDFGSSCIKLGLNPYTCVGAQEQSKAWKYIFLQDFCKKMTAANIAVMASGGAPPTYRFYFHSQRADTETRILVESIVDKNTSSMQVTIKADDSDSPELFQRLYQTILGGLQ